MFENIFSKNIIQTLHLEQLSFFYLIHTLKSQFSLNLKVFLYALINYWKKICKNALIFSNTIFMNSIFVSNLSITPQLMLHYTWDFVQILKILMYSRYIGLKKIR